MYPEHIAMKEIAHKFSKFFGEVGSEFRKTSWPERRELVESTMVVLTFIVLLACVVLACDFVIKLVLSWIRV
jgi:preprotein translocase subunit SecE